MDLEPLLNAGERAAGEEQAWLKGWRLEAAESARSTGLPTLKTEDWKYTSLGALSKKSVRPTVADDLPHADLTRVRDLLPPLVTPRRLVFVNGVLSEQASDLPSDHNLTITRFADLSETQQRAVKNATQNDDAVFSQLNAATLSEGVYIEIADDVAEVLELSVVFLALHEEGLLRAPRLAVFTGRNSRVRIIEEYISAQHDPGITNAVTDLHLEDGAELWHHRIQEEALDSAQIGRINAVVGRDAHFHSDSVVFGGALTRVDIAVKLAERGAECTLNGLFAVEGSQHVDHHTVIEHCVGYTHSRELYRGILDEQSRGVFNGKVVVRQDAQRITAEQASNNLLLSREAEIDTKPELEIYADDVSCAHGATVGELDQDALFYLRSRGISMAEARALLIYAFAEKVIEAIPLDHVRNHIEQRFIGHQDLSETLRQF